MIDLLSLGHITSHFGHRSSPGGVGSTDHKGVDIVLKSKKIPAVLSGKVVENEFNSARGWYITVQDANGYKQRYQHMASKSPLSVGSAVTEGQNIGTMGSTGASTGAHLHFEVLTPQGQNINPESWLKGATGKPDYHGGVSASNSGGVLGSLRQTAANIAQNIVVTLFCILLILGMFLFFVRAMDMHILH